MYAEILEERAVGEAVDDELGGRPRYEHLTAARERTDARTSIQRLAAIQAVLNSGLPRVYRKPQQRLGAVRPIGGRDGVLQRDRKSGGVGGAGEGCDEAVAFTLFDRFRAVVGVDELADEAVECGDGLGGSFGTRLPHRGRADDIPEHKRDGSGGQAAARVGPHVPVDRIHRRTAWRRPKPGSSSFRLISQWPPSPRPDDRPRRAESTGLASRHLGGGCGRVPDSPALGSRRARIALPHIAPLADVQADRRAHAAACATRHQEDPTRT